MTVSELENRMEAAELNEWMAYFAREPWGAQHADFRAGVVCTTLAAVMGGNNKAKPTDFFPIYTSRNDKPAAMGAEAQMNMFKEASHGRSGL